jgi:hypothetical protein
MDLPALQHHGFSSGRMAPSYSRKLMSSTAYLLKKTYPQGTEGMITKSTLALSVE